MNPRVWEAQRPRRRRSRDPMVDCRNCKHRFRADHLKGPTTRSRARTAARRARSPRRGSSTSCSRPTSARSRTTASVAYLRPETAQGMFVNFDNVRTTTRSKLPFGIAQIGKSLPQRDHARQLHLPRPRVRADGDGVLRASPARRGQWFAYWVDERLRWWTDALGIAPEQPAPAPARAGRALALLEADDRHRVPLPVGLVRARGHRQPHRLRPEAHAAASGKKLTYFDEATDEHVVPYVIEPAVGVDRTFLDRPARRLRGGGGWRARSASCCASSPRSRRSRSAVLPLLAQRPELVERGARWPTRPEAALMAATYDDTAVDRQALPPPGRDRHAVLRHRRLRLPRRSARPRSASATR